MQRLVPSIWFNRNAREAADFYTSALPNTSVGTVQYYPEAGLPKSQREFAGQPITVELDVAGFKLSMTNADDTFAPNPSISFMLNFDPAAMDDPREALRQTWEKLSEGGQILMPLDSYDFSEYFGWCADRYGVNWQLMLTRAEGEPRPFIMPALLFTREARGKAATAREKYLQIFGEVAESAAGNRVDYPDFPGVILFSDAQLAGEWVVINDSTFDHAFTFSEGVSFQVFCADQPMIDRLWQAMAHEEQPCGWCKDEFGVSWQILPQNFEELMGREGAFEKLMQMTKIRIEQF